MKRLAVILIALCVVSCVFATEFERNPDHYPSISFGLGVGAGDGELNRFSSGWPIDQTFFFTDSH